jgi:hypothetical protein
MMIERSIRLVAGSKHEGATGILVARDRQCHLVLRYCGKSIEESASDYFEAFCRIRERLKEEGSQPLCYAASLNVYPSGMARDMGAGLKAYRMTIGKPADRRNIVDILRFWSRRHSIDSRRAKTVLQDLAGVGKIMISGAGVLNL